MLSSLNEPIALDPALFVGTDAAALAQIVAEETEAQRVAEGGGARGMVPMSTLAALTNSDFEAWAANGKHWYEFLANPQVVRRCALRVGVQMPEFLARCMRDLKPANWDTLWWMKSYLSLLESNHKQFLARAEVDAAARDFSAEQVARDRTEFAKKGANARHVENRAMRVQAVAWYTERRATMTKDAAAEAMAGKVLPVKFRTIRAWLTGV